MQQHPFTMRQMFRLKPKTLDKRITVYYLVSREAICTLKLIRLLQIRNDLGTEVIDQPCRELARRLYLACPVTRGMKRYVYYFRTYFSESEWQEVLLRIFPVFPLLDVWKLQQAVTLLQIVQKACFTVP